MKCNVIAWMIKAICLVITIVASASARIINVPAEYSTIQTGIDASVSGDTVLVATGEYWEDINPNEKNILLTSSNGPDSTIIQGYIRLTGALDSTFEFRGFKVIGQATEPMHGWPIIQCIGTGARKITGNILTGNIGCGIDVYQCGAVIRHNIIENNWNPGGGGGIYFTPDSNSEISYNVIRNNRSGFFFYNIGNGAGIICTRGRIFYNLIYGNEVRSAADSNSEYGTGGGITAKTGGSGRIYIYNNTIVNNAASRPPWGGGGGGIYAEREGQTLDTILIENNIIAYNNIGGVTAPFSLITGYNLFYGNIPYDLLAPDTSESNIFGLDPLFADTSNDDYNLLAGSPCIDAGNPNYPLDPDSTIVDIGAIFFDRRVSIDDEDGFISPHNFFLSQNYPNPFNSETIISFYLAEVQVVNLRIFDITGRVVKRLITDEQLEPGEHRVIWDGRDNSGEGVVTAIYFAELEVEGSKFVKSMILIR